MDAGAAEAVLSQQTVAAENNENSGNEDNLPSIEPVTACSYMTWI